jgi:hypothetical protein
MLLMARESKTRPWNERAASTCSRLPPVGALPARISFTTVAMIFLRERHTCHLANSHSPRQLRYIRFPTLAVLQSKGRPLAIVTVEVVNPRQLRVSIG